MRSRRSDRAGHKHDPATVDEVLVWLGEEADEANRWPWNTAAGRTKHAMAASVPPQMQHMQLQQVPPAQPYDVQLPQAFQDLQLSHGWQQPHYALAAPYEEPGNCWNCGRPGHRHFQCNLPLRPELQQRIASQMAYGRGGGGKGRGNTAYGGGQPYGQCPERAP